MTPTRMAPASVALMLETDGPGGTERMVLQIAASLHRRGHRVLPVLPDNGSGWLAGQFRSLGIEAHSYSLRRPLDIRCLARLAILLRRHKIDVVHSHEFTMAVYGAVAASLCGARHVITMHGSRYFAVRARRRAALGWACRRADAVVAVSSATRRDIDSVLHLAPDAITVVHNGVALEPGDRSAVRLELGVGTQEFLIVAVGNVMAVKGHITLLRALTALRKRRPDLSWRLAIAGRERDQAAALRGHAEQHGFLDRLHLLGYRADVANLLAAADVYVMPSLSEGLPLALLEAMAAGKAVIASAVGGVPEVITNGFDGHLTAPSDVGAVADALERVLSDARHREALGRAARRRVADQFGVDKMVAAYARLYGIESLAPATAHATVGAAGLPSGRPA